MLLRFLKLHIVRTGTWSNLNLVLDKLRFEFCVLNQGSFLWCKKLWIVETRSWFISFISKWHSVYRVDYSGSIGVEPKTALRCFFLGAESRCWVLLIILRSWKLSFMYSDSFFWAKPESLCLWNIDHIFANVVKCSLKLFFLLRHEKSSCSWKCNLCAWISQSVCWLKSCYFPSLKLWFFLQLFSNLLSWFLNTRAQTKDSSAWP